MGTSANQRIDSRNPDSTQGAADPSGMFILDFTLCLLNPPAPELTVLQFYGFNTDENRSITGALYLEIMIKVTFLTKSINVFHSEVKLPTLILQIICVAFCHLLPYRKRP